MGYSYEGRISLTKWFFQLPNVIFDRLEVVDAPENIHTALQDIVEHLHIKSLSIVLRPHIEEVPTPRVVLQAEVSILQKLKLPKLDIFNVEDKPVLTFINALFSLPQLETFRLNLSALKFSSHHTGLIHVHSSWQCHSRGRRLAKYTIHR